MPGVIGILFTDCTKRLVGASVSMLLGMRFNCNAPGSCVIAAFNVATGMEARKMGVLIRLDPIRPIVRRGLRLHQMIVHELVRIGSQAELAAERPVEGEDQKDNQANKGSEKDDLYALKPTILDSEKKGQA